MGLVLGCSSMDSIGLLGDIVVFLINGDALPYVQVLSVRMKPKKDKKF